MFSTNIDGLGESVLFILFSYETLAINRGSMLDWQHCQRFIMGQADASFIKQFNYISTYV